jgi:lipopolysaccharide/colanic/teichoic acid biosynthesis glycosyltransferase
VIPSVIAAEASIPFLKNLQEPISYAGEESQWQLQRQLAVKSWLDTLLAMAIVLILSPGLLLIGLLVKLSSPGPVLYQSERVGYNKKIFYMYKFRTMVQSADQLRSQLRVENQQTQELFKLKDDPRITPLGKFLRAYSLDEFPQLLNVLRGEMSLVGPRPFTPDDCLLFKEPYTRRFSVLPGMTGAWQIGGRSLTSFQRMCELEMEYIQSWSLLLDFRILVMTIPAMLFCRGAY